MEESAHYHTDPYGYRYQINVTTDDLVVFGSTPPLSFDWKAHGLKLAHGTSCDYTLAYQIKDGQLFLLCFQAKLHRPKPIFENEPITSDNRGVTTYSFDSLPVDYSGVMTVGKDFDRRFWKHDEKADPVPFCPEVYKQNGFLQFENGYIIKADIKPRDNR